MHTELFFFITFVGLAWIAWRARVKPIKRHGSIDAIVPAFNEEICIAEAVQRLLRNPYFRSVIVVNDGSTDRTGALLDLLALSEPGLKVIHKDNGGKGSALMAGIRQAETPYVFLTDADTFLPEDKDGLGYLIAEIEAGADAVGGVPLSDLQGAGLLPHIRASTKLAVITIQRTFQQLVGGAPFLISGACGLFRTDVIRAVPFSDRTKVEDLDLTWSLISKGYTVRQSNRCFVYSQECNSMKAEWLRWRRWIAGYAVCMRLHRNLLLTRYGLLTIIPVFLSSFIAFGYMAYALAPLFVTGDFMNIPLYLLPWAWMIIIYLVGVAAAIHHRKPWLFLLAPAALLYVIMAYSVWLIYGLKSLFTGQEPQRDKPQRYSHVVA
jgi:cellulose synthase/poly-beta-1,6-N-acetylglucosamine synthase-like glycosyltransferase